MKDPVEVFKDAAGGYRYRVRARNGQILCTSEAYISRFNAERGAEDMLDVLASQTLLNAVPLSAGPPPGVSYVFRARVARWVDGDTVDLRVAMPFHQALGNDDEPARFRLYGIEAPKISLPEGKRAAAYSNTECPVGGLITVRSYRPYPETVPDKPDSFGRWLAEIWTADGRNHNRTMLDQGYAVPFVR